MLRASVVSDGLKSSLRLSRELRACATPGVTVAARQRRGQVWPKLRSSVTIGHRRAETGSNGQVIEMTPIFVSQYTYCTYSAVLAVL